MDPESRHPERHTAVTSATNVVTNVVSDTFNGNRKSAKPFRQCRLPPTVSRPAQPCHNICREFAVVIVAYMPPNLSW